ncbi:flagellar basal body rod protein FlgB [Clostridium folliculivorans]|uniref:Flagellar basal body rod protein FlgB n=1 Tax=Clostridium folliculivorans TaxID=2886038 RepID=A0A9W6D9A6_9CLOT|nr:flagellar basal body rod protein FlgB [Clostridium folliculivorans]GKU23567.1 flagellar basal body rod protein FlgB [Clostridium folliculivorans]GKU29683.1 flagellar basal body rod protein FlgB [Clostridium folliculivorans]
MTISRVDSDNYTYNLIKRGLDVSSLRSKVIANNMANINTAGYKRSTVSFEDTLKDASSDIENTGYTNVDENSYGQVKLDKDTSSSMRTDGNNVDLESEKVNQAANTLLYNALITQANNKLSTTRYVITGGGR